MNTGQSFTESHPCILLHCVYIIYITTLCVYYIYYCTVCILYILLHCVYIISTTDFMCAYIHIYTTNLYVCTSCARSCVPAWRACVGCLWSAVLCLLAGLQLEEFPPASRCSLAPTESVTDILVRVQQDQLPREVTYSSHPVPSSLFRRKQSAPAAVTTAMSRLLSSGQRFGSGEYTGSC